jgi:hypothetical protein
MIAMKYQKPHTWKPSKDAELCIVCEKPFERGQKIFDDGYLTLHESCLAEYGRQLEELGLRP